MKKISIHALREEGDGSVHLRGLRHRYFYPRPPQGGRPLQFPLVRTDDVISIHALREEGDLKGQKKVVGRYLFLSTPSARRATDATTTGSNTGTFLSTPSARRATDKR